MSRFTNVSRLPQVVRRFPFLPTVRHLTTSTFTAASSTTTPAPASALSDVVETVASATSATLGSMANSIDNAKANGGSKVETGNGVEHLDRSKRYVRLAGPASYSTRDDVINFLQEQGVESPPKFSVVQGQSDVFQNHSIWMIETDSQEDAVEMASRISGRVLGLKLVRAAAVDQKLYDSLMTTPTNLRTSSLRKRLTIIGPKREERGRTLLVRQLHPNVTSRAIWAFFGSYDVIDVRYLRKSGVACVVFQSEEEAFRALRERKNVPIQRQFNVSLKMHE